MRPSVQGGSADSRRADGDLGPSQNAHFPGAGSHHKQQWEDQKFHDLGPAHSEG